MTEYFQNIVFNSPVMVFFYELSSQIKILDEIEEKLEKENDDEKVKKLVTEYSCQIEAIILSDFQFNRNDCQSFFNDVAEDIAVAINRRLDEIITSYPLLRDKVNNLKKGEEDILRLKHILNSKVSSAVQIILSFFGQVKVCQNVLSKMNEMIEHEKNSNSIFDFALTAIVAYANPVVGITRAFQQMSQAKKIEKVYESMDNAYYKEFNALISIYSQMSDAISRLNTEWNSFTPKIYVNFSKVIISFFGDMSKSDLDLSIYLELTKKRLSYFDAQSIKEKIVYEHSKNLI